MPRLFPNPLSEPVSRPLLAASARVASLAPWKYMSDLELIGMRDDAGKLYVASVLGCLGTVFAVVIYRNALGLHGIHELATTREPADAERMFECMDYLKVEWCRKGGLQKSDLQTLQAAGFQPNGRGPIWPRFETATPGWYPWGLADDEARLMTGLLEKVARFIYLRKSVGALHSEPIEARLPIVPAGGETSLKAADIEWLPFVVPPPPIPEPMALTAEEEVAIRAFPAQPGLILEMLMPLVPEMACLDEAAGRPCIPRVAFIVECRTQAIVCARLATARTTFAEGAARALTDTLRQAKVRPASIRVENEKLAAVLRPACTALGIGVEVGRLRIARAAFQQFETFVQSQTPR